MVNYRKDQNQVFSGINIVPFTDIVLVLLVIFMIAAPGIATMGLNVNLPGSSSASSQPPGRIAVALDRSGHIYLNNREISDEALRLRIKELAVKGELRVVLNADSGSRHGQVIRLLDLLRSSGAGKIYVGTVKK